MKDSWNSNFLKFNFTKRVGRFHKKRSFEHVSSFRLKKNLSSILLQHYFTSLFKIVFPHPLFKLSSWKNQSQKNFNVWLSLTEAKKKFRQKYHRLILFGNVSEIDSKLQSHSPKISFSKKNNWNLCGKNNTFTKKSMCYGIFVPKPFP